MEKVNQISTFFHGNNLILQECEPDFFGAMTFEREVNFEIETGDLKRQSKDHFELRNF